MDLATEENVFPDDLKAQIISLAIWVDKHSSRVLRGDATVDSLITVNRTVMEGLATIPEQPAAQPSAQPSAQPAAQPAAAEQLIGQLPGSWRQPGPNTPMNRGGC